MAQMRNGGPGHHQVQELYGRAIGDARRCQLAATDKTVVDVGGNDNNNSSQQEPWYMISHYYDHGDMSGTGSELVPTVEVPQNQTSHRPTKSNTTSTTTSTSTTSSTTSSTTRPSSNNHIEIPQQHLVKVEHNKRNTDSKNSNTNSDNRPISKPSPMPVSTVTAGIPVPAVAPKPSKNKHSRRPQTESSSTSAHNKFHVNENNGPAAVQSHACAADSESRTLRFVGKQGLAKGGNDITSEKGTVRGVTNRVRAGINSFTYKPQDNKQKNVNNEKERDKIIVYTTSMRIVRQTFEDCQFVRKLFQNHRVRFEERDLFMNARHQQELYDRIVDSPQQQITLPIVFIDGELVGDVEILETLNENGELRKILERFEKVVVRSDCGECGGFRYVPCRICNGSKKSLNRNHFTDQFHALRCAYCDENGLQKCTLCNK